MKRTFQKMMRDQVQEDVNSPAGLVHKPAPKGGWINVIRKALGMTTYQLAERLKCSQSNITALERREVSGSISLESLDSAAKAMNCKLVYFLIPDKPLEELLKERARDVAKNKLRSIEHSMELEQQGLTPAQRKQQEEELVKELLRGNPKALWDTSDEV